MKVLNQLPVPQDSNPNFLFGAIQNETDTQDGTPVVRELYNDLVQNLYKLLNLTAITPTGTEDSEASQYQIVEAIRKLPNLLNDSEKVLTLVSGVWNADFNLDLLPNKYFFFARASDAYVSGSVYTFKGSTATTYSFTSAGFSASDELLIIIDQATVRAYSLTSINATSTDVFTVLGQPIGYNESNVMRYQEQGTLMTDLPSVDYLENTIRLDTSDGTMLMNDIFITRGFVLCFCYSVANETYHFYQFPLNDFSESEEVGAGLFAAGVENNPYVFVGNDGFVYSTNNVNFDAEDYSIAKLEYLPSVAEMNLVSNFNLDISFQKTSNTVILGDNLFTMIMGQLDRYSLLSGVKTSLGFYNGVNGQIFGFNGFAYFTSGEVAKKWTL